MTHTKQSLLEENTRLSERNTILEQYLWDTVREVQPECYVMHTNDAADRVTGKLYRAMSASGGYVVLIYGNAAGEQTGCEIRYLEEISNSLRNYHDEHTLPVRIVIERLMIARNKLYQAA